MRSNMNPCVTFRMGWLCPELFQLSTAHKNVTQKSVTLHTAHKKVFIGEQIVLHLKNTMIKPLETTCHESSDDDPL